MAVFLNTLLKNIFPELEFRTVPHEGKSDLKRSIPSKLRSLADERTFFIILMDQDKNDCYRLKAELEEICKKSENSNYKIRIVCHELESWYLGDLASMDIAFKTKIAQYQNKRKYRHPDEIANAKQESQRITGRIEQIHTATRMGNAMTRSSAEQNRSKSFQVFLRTLLASFAS
jgi:hypothetical protein